MRTLVVYNTKNGLTQQVAQYLARRLHGTVLDSKFVTPQDLSQCDVLIYGGRVQFGRVTGLAPFMRTYQSSVPAQFAIFGTGFERLSEREQGHLLSRLDKQCARSGMPFFYFRNALVKNEGFPKIISVLKLLKRRNDCPTISAAARPLIAWALDHTS